MYRAVALALSAMPMTLALVSLGLSLLLVVGGAQGQHDHAAATTTGCPPGQRQAVGYPMVCDPAYKANTESGVGKGSGTYTTMYRVGPVVCHIGWVDLDLDIALHPIPLTRNSDIWNFRLHGPFLAGPERNGLSYNKIFRI